MWLEDSVLQFTRLLCGYLQPEKGTQANSSLPGPPTPYPYSPSALTQTPRMAKRDVVLAKCPESGQWGIRIYADIRSACQHQISFPKPAIPFQHIATRLKALRDLILKGRYFAIPSKWLQEGHHGNCYLSSGVFKTSSQHLKSVACL